MGAGARDRLGRPIWSWRDLYKADAAILTAFRGQLDILYDLFTVNGARILAPDDLGPIPSGRAFADELIHLVGMYGLDSSDALILMEAQRFGVTDVVTLDADTQRAQADFTGSTWL